MKNTYDIIIIGAGVTGMASAMYAGRLNLKTLVIGTNSANELPIGGVITLTEVVENYPGFIRLTGPELAENIRKHALDYKDKVEIKEDLVLDVKKHGDCFDVVTKSGKRFVEVCNLTFETRTGELIQIVLKNPTGFTGFPCALLSFRSTLSNLDPLSAKIKNLLRMIRFVPLIRKGTKSKESCKSCLI